MLPQCTVTGDNTFCVSESFLFPLWVGSLVCLGPVAVVDERQLSGVVLEDVRAQNSPVEPREGTQAHEPSAIGNIELSVADRCLADITQ